MGVGVVNAKECNKSRKRNDVLKAVKGVLIALKVADNVIFSAGEADELNQRVLIGF